MATPEGQWDDDAPRWLEVCGHRLQASVEREEYEEVT